MEWALRVRAHSSCNAGVLHCRPAWRYHTAHTGNVGTAQQVCNDGVPLLLHTISRRFIGAAAQDEAGDAFADDLAHSGVAAEMVAPLATAADAPSAISLCLVTPDGERTMRTCLGAAQLLTADALPAAALQRCAFLHCEGYTLYKPTMLRKALTTARQHGAQTSLDLGSFEVVAHCQEPLLAVLEAGLVDLLFCNEGEAAALHSAVHAQSHGALVHFLVNYVQHENHALCNVCRWQACSTEAQTAGS